MRHPDDECTFVLFQSTISLNRTLPPLSSLGTRSLPPLNSSLQAAPSAGRGDGQVNPLDRRLPTLQHVKAQGEHLLFLLLYALVVRPVINTARIDGPARNLCRLSISSYAIGLGSDVALMRTTNIHGNLVTHVARLIFSCFSIDVEVY